ncbi:MFS transporter [Cohnella fermenti]|uniref:MFS transporter n=1 Tax=Cohnella fermenti TaxID=2565925 RepID=A0A4S4BQC5_9BACL|nr:MFS transporter [Cohnella fermenti]THF77137.1 MFS transporter [Cohnella fermenti]
MTAIRQDHLYGGFKQVVAVSIGLFLVFLDTTIVNIALPSMTRDLQIGLSTASWIINAFVITVAVLLVALGKLADIFGSYRTYMTGLLLFTAASLLCGFAPNAASLIASRVLQGIGAAAVVPASLVLVRAAVPPRQVGAAMGIWGGVGALAIAIGPSLGGIVTEYWNWEWIFFVNLPIVAVSLPMTTLAFSNHRDRRAPFRLDVLGVVTLGISLFGLTYAILQGQEAGWGAPRIVGSFAISLVSALLFLYIESRTREPLIELSMLRSRVYLAGMAANFLSGVLMMGTLIVLPLYFTNVKEFSVLTSSLMITPLSAVMLIVAPLVGRLIDKVRYYIPMLIGFGFAVAGFLLLSGLQADLSNGYLIGVMAIAGTGIGILMVTSVTIGTASVPEPQVSLGSAVYATARNMGGAVGVALFVSIMLNSANGYAASAAEEAIASVRQAELPAPVETKAIQWLNERQGSLLSGSGTEQEQGTAWSLELSEAERQQLDDSGLLAETTAKLQRLEQDLKTSVKDYTVKAMARAFTVGLILSGLFSISLPFLRERKERLPHTGNSTYSVE